MNISRHCAAAVLSIAALSLSSCIDDNYDLSDIDTNVQVQVKDLVLPLNLDAITLDNVLDLDDESVIKDINGEYAIFKTGDIDSDEVKIDVVTVTPQHVDVSRTEIFKYDGADVDLPTLTPGVQVNTYEINDASSDFEFHKSDVDAAIKRLDKIKVSWVIGVRVAVEDDYGVFTSLAFRDLTVKLPKGLTTPGFENEDGVIKVPDFDLTPGHKEYTINIPVTAIDITAMDAGQFKLTPGVDREPGRIDFRGTAGVYSGYLVTTSAASISNIPQSVFLNNEPQLSDITIKSFSGMIDYTFDDFKAPSIALDDLPDVLQGEDTDITLVNPQLYLSINNPVAGYDVAATSGLTLIPVRNGVDGDDKSLDPGQTITLGYDKGVDGPYTQCLSPVKPDSYFEGFSDAGYVGYSALSTVLTGAGLPQEIKVNFDDPGIHNAEVRDFVLGESLGKVSGHYTIYAPLALDTNSHIVYTDTQDGWGDETMEKLTITKLNIRASLTNDMPFDLTITGYPIDSNGRQCIDPATGAPVVLEGVKVSGNTTADIDMGVSGAVTDLDGIHFVARANVVSTGSLKPSTEIKLTNIRVTVSGHYDDEF